MVNKTGIIAIEFIPDRQSYNGEPTRPTRKFTMATMYIKPSEDKPQFGCYSERGLMSYFMFVELPNLMAKFLSALEFPDQDNAGSPFKGIKKENITNATIFSELDFGKQGFGCPDGAIYFENNGISTIILIEVKADESYAESCKKKKYNSTIKGQLELRWRMINLLFKEKTREKDGKHYIYETPDLKKTYQDHDRFYKNKPDEDFGSYRRLKITKGVEKVLEYFKKCKNRVYFCAITKEGENPFTLKENKENLPVCHNEKWGQVKQQFCWLPITKIEDTRTLNP